MAEYDSSIALALRLIQKKGGDITVRRFDAPVANSAMPWKPTAGDPLSTDQVVRGVVLPLPVDRKYADGSQVRAGSQICLVAPAGVTFDPDVGNHVILADGSVWTVRARILTAPNGRKVLFELWMDQ